MHNITRTTHSSCIERQLINVKNMIYVKLLNVIFISYCGNTTHCMDDRVANLFTKKNCLALNIYSSNVNISDN